MVALLYRYIITQLFLVVKGFLKKLQCTIDNLQLLFGISRRFIPIDVSLQQNRAALAVNIAQNLRKILRNFIKFNTNPQRCVIIIL